MKNYAHENHVRGCNVCAAQRDVAVDCMLFFARVGVLVGVAAGCVIGFGIARLIGG
jgi:hypothetical protein